jgi:hypothetical protein
MNLALLSKQATEENTLLPYGTIHAEIPSSSPAAVAVPEDGPKLRPHH